MATDFIVLVLSLWETALSERGGPSAWLWYLRVSHGVKTTLKMFSKDARPGLSKNLPFFYGEDLRTVGFSLQKPGPRPVGEDQDLSFLPDSG